jgi:hypothetical protein
MYRVEVEVLAVAKIQSMVGRCPHLKPFLVSNDKTPFTDGHIDAYRGLGQKKTDWLGRVSVQVKGRTRSGKQKEQLTFGISRTDLLGFQKDSGVLYFFVAVDRQGRCAPYFALLSPFTIEHYLRQVPEEQMTVSIPFKKFRNDPSEIERIVALALKTKDQRPSLGFEPSLFEKMQSITVHTTTDLKLDAPMVLTPGEMDYALEVITEGGMTLPLGGELHIFPQAYTERAVDVTISAGSATYEEITIRRIDAQTIEAKLDTGLALTMAETGEQRVWNVKFVAQSNFAARLKAAEFLVGLVDHGAIEVNGEATSLGQTTSDGLHGINELRDRLEFLRRLSELFDRLGVDSALVEFDELDDEQIRNLENLHRAFLMSEEPYNEAGELARGLMAVGRWLLMIMIMPGSVPHRWRYVDPFDPEAPHMLRWSADDNTRDTMPVTAYDTIEQEHLPKVLNLRLDSIVSAYEAIVDSGQTLGLANQRVLALLLAADASGVRKDEFLRAAESLNEWLIIHEGEKAVHLINRWQILWRRDALTVQQRDGIRGLKRQMTRSSDNMAQEAELACALLAGDDEDANYLISQMSEEKLQVMRTWPIWALRKTALEAKAG